MGDDDGRPSSGARSRTVRTPFATIAQRVDVEARVGLVEQGHDRLEQRHLQDLVALALAAGEPVVQVALGEGAVHAEPVHPLGEVESDLEDAQLVQALARGDRLAQELDDRDAADRLGVLEGEEDPGAGALVGRPGRDVLAAQEDLAARRRGSRGGP